MGAWLTKRLFPPAARTIGVISATRSAEADAPSFVARAYGLAPTLARPDNGNVPIRLSASELLEIAVGDLSSFYRRRARRTALDGVQVLKTGIWWVVVILIIAVILIVAGASLIALCSIGSVTDKGLCAVAPYILLLGS